MIIFVDMDGVICTEEKTFERALAQPLPGAKEALAELANAGHEIIIYTARSWAETKMTKEWLDRHGILYDGVQMGRPICDVVVDDRAIRFHDWGQVLGEIAQAEPKYVGGPTDEALLRIIRQETKDFLIDVANRADLLEPVLEVGRMVFDRTGPSVFDRMPETFVDSRELFADRGIAYTTMDIDPATKPDIVGDLADAKNLLEPESVGAVLLLHVIEHMPRVWEIPEVLKTILKPGGRAFILTPWNLRFHGPRPDCWRISDDGYEALFGDCFEIEALEKIGCPGRPLSPVGFKCILRKAPEPT